MEPLRIGIHAMDRIKAHINVGSTMVIQGAGAVGLGCLVAAKELRGFKTIVVGAPEARLKIAKRFGADVTVNIDEIPDVNDRIKLVKNQTEGQYGADVVFEATGVPSAILEGIDMLRRGGVNVTAGHFTDAGETKGFNAFKHLTNKQIRVVEFGVQK